MPESVIALTKSLFVICFFRPLSVSAISSVSLEFAIETFRRSYAGVRNHFPFGAYSEKFFTTLSNYGISRYQNDILIAGCHAIAYKEMERAAIELGIEKKEGEKTVVAITA